MKREKKKNLFKNKWFLIILVIFLILLGFKVYNTFLKEVKVEQKVQKKVELINISKVDKPFLENQCKISSENTVNIVAETGGKITRLYKQNNDKVKKGDLIMSLKSLQQQAAVQNAKVALQQAKLALKDMTENTRGQNFEELKKQQELVVKNAYTAFLNNDLRFYPEDEQETDLPPVVSGNYNCNKEGKYVLETYSSAADSGGSFRFSGLESGIQTVYTAYPGSLGGCGLQVKFPFEFSKDKKWILEIPNKKSSSYQQALQAYELAKQNQNLSLKTNKVSDEKISQQQNVIKQARINLQIAYDNLAKTQIRATSNGVITNLNLHKGDSVAPGGVLLKIKGTEKIQAEAFFDQNETKYISKNSQAFVDNKEVKINTISQVLDDSSNKAKIVFDLDSKDFKNQDGQFFDCKIKIDDFENLKNQKTIIPLSALSVLGDTYYIFYLKENQVRKSEVKTGGVFGDKIEIYDFDRNISNIIKDTRGLYEGKFVQLTEK